MSDEMNEALAACARGEHSYTLEPSEIGLIQCIHCRQQDPPTWLTVHEVTREFGGPEEGGWYYSAGSVTVNVALHDYTPDEIFTLYTLMIKSFPRTHYSSSVVPRGGDWTVTVGMTSGADYPEERPHYE